MSGGSARAQALLAAAREQRPQQQSAQRLQGVQPAPQLRAPPAPTYTAAKPVAQPPNGTPALDAFAKQMLIVAKMHAEVAAARERARPAPRPVAAAAPPSSLPFRAPQPAAVRRAFHLPPGADRKERTELLTADIQRAVSAATPATTKRTYETYQKQYLEFCSTNNLPEPTGPDMELYISAFILSRSIGPKALAYSTLSGPVRAALGALVPLQNERPTTTQVVRKALYAASHTAPARVMAKAPLPADWLVKIVSACWKSGTTTGTRDGAMFVFMALGLLRRSEAVALRKADVRERTVKLPNGSQQRCVEIAVLKAKNDQQRKGSLRLLPAASDAKSAICPVGALLRLNTITYGHADESPLFFNVNDEKQKRSPYHIRAAPVALAAATPNRRLKHWMQHCGADEELVKRTGSHSLRKAGATAAFAAHVPRLTIQRAGAWRSDAVDSYISVSEADHAICWKEMIDSIDDVSDDDE